MIRYVTLYATCYDMFYDIVRNDTLRYPIFLSYAMLRYLARRIYIYIYMRTYAYICAVLDNEASHGSTTIQRNK